MRPGWIIGLAMLFILLHLVNGICEMTFVTGEPELIFDSLINKVQIVSSEDTSWFGKIWAGVGVGWEVLVLLWRMFWFDYAFLTGDWVLLRFIFMSISVGIIVAFFFAVRGTSSS